MRVVCNVCEGAGNRCYTLKELCDGSGVKDRANFERNYLADYKTASAMVDKDISYFSGQIRLKLSSV